MDLRPFGFPNRIIKAMVEPVQLKEKIGLSSLHEKHHICIHFFELTSTYEPYIFLKPTMYFLMWFLFMLYIINVIHEYTVFTLFPCFPLPLQLFSLSHCLCDSCTLFFIMNMVTLYSHPTPTPTLLTLLSILYTYMSLGLIAWDRIND